MAVEVRLEGRASVRLGAARVGLVGRGGLRPAPPLHSLRARVSSASPTAGALLGEILKTESLRAW